VNVPPEIGYDIPWQDPNWVNPRKVARRLTIALIIALIVGVLAGLAIMLIVASSTTLSSEAGGACGSGKGGISYGACPRGTTPALIISILLLIPVLPAFFFLFRKGWARRGCLAVGTVAGLFAGQALWASWHGTELSVAWTAPGDSSTSSRSWRPAR
jgi:hypothetical protein